MRGKGTVVWVEARRAGASVCYYANPFAHPLSGSPHRLRVCQRRQVLRNIVLAQSEAGSRSGQAGAPAGAQDGAASGAAGESSAQQLLRGALSQLSVETNQTVKYSRDGIKVRGHLLVAT